jgi:hypothetical protein
VLAVDGKTLRGSRHIDRNGIEVAGRHLLAVIDQHTRDHLTLPTRWCEDAAVRIGAHVDTRKAELRRLTPRAKASTISG